MDFFNYKNNELHVEDVSVASLAEEYETPLYIYSKSTLERHYKAFDNALSGINHLICFAVKANSNLSILSLMAKQGAGFDVVSEGELRRVIKAGGDAGKVVFSGVGKTEKEIRFALSSGIKCLNIESEAELEVVSRVAAELKIVAPVALRVNPDVDAKTLPAISTGLKNNKFGIPIENAVAIYKRIAADPNLKASGIDCHIGSQMTSNFPILEATGKLMNLYDALIKEGIKVDHLDVGGGLGVTYDDETPPEPKDYFDEIKKRLSGTDLELFIEPGRAMVANAGILVSRVVYLKNNGTKNFCIVDAGMNDLIRPALYNAVMKIIPVAKKDGDLKKYDVVGPVCESDDFLGKERELIVEQGDLIAVRGAGAYGSSMSSTYNGRPLVAELLVSDDKVEVIRKRQSFEEMWAGELV